MGTEGVGALSRAGVLCVSLSAMLGASAGAAPLSFSDEAVARGVNFTVSFNYTQYGAGTMLADLDGDGDLDIMIAGGSGGAMALYENDGAGHFTSRTIGSGLTPMTIASGLAGADYDNDGDIDIFVSGWFTPSRLYRNDGGFMFTDVAAEAGVNITCATMGSCWSDVDGDGRIDLYAAVRTLTNGDLTRNFLFMNNGDGTFTDKAALMGVDAGDDPTLLSSFFDYDRDGDDDIYLGTDKGSGGVLYNKLYRNDGGGAFTDVTFDANAQAHVDCMGIAVGDLDFDGFYDMYLTNTQHGNKLYLYDPVDQSYVDQTISAGVGNHRVGWGTTFADFDNDTNLDIYLCNTQGDNRLYRGSLSWPLVDEGPGAGVAEASDVFCVSQGDIDNDGDIDLLVGDTNGRAHLYINNSPDLSKNYWVRFNVVGHGDTFGVGTCVDITADGKSQVRQVRSGTNYKAHDAYALHFGLGASDRVDEIEVIFANNKALRYLSNAPANQTWTIYPPSRLGDPDGSGRIEYDELMEAVRLRTAPGASIVPGQEIFDMDGDFDIDNDDLLLMGLGIRTPSVFR